MDVKHPAALHQKGLINYTTPDGSSSVTGYETGILTGKNNCGCLTVKSSRQDHQWE